MSSTLPLLPPVFSILSSLIEERLGLHFGADQRELLADKLSPRVLERGFSSMLDYYYFIRYDAEGSAELASLADVLTVNETFFFREAAQLRALVDEFIATWLVAGRRPRIWCAACSTGEEPLSLAALLDERGWLKRVDIVASDLSPRVLSLAKTGSYSQRSLRAFDEPPRWLVAEGDRYVPSAQLRTAIEWCCVNLLDRTAVESLGRFDAILCRNVLIYFSDQTTKIVAEQLFQRLTDGGVLLVGASESLMRMGTSFTCEERSGAFFYRKSAT
jgi:chemotaxis protein methyltransferase CheR